MELECCFHHIVIDQPNIQDNHFIKFPSCNNNFPLRKFFRTYINYINEIYAWAIFSQDVSNNVIRGSIRSRGPIINEAASHFGGGGHIFASGVRIKTFEEVDELIKELDDICSTYKDEE